MSTGMCCVSTECDACARPGMNASDTAVTSGSGERSRFLAVPKCFGGSSISLTIETAEARLYNQPAADSMAWHREKA